MELKSMNDVSGKMKSFWERKEGNTGLITLGALGFFALWLFNKYGDNLAHMFDNALNIGLSLTGLAILVTVVTNKRVHRIFELLMYWLTDVFIEMNPLLVMDEYLDGLENDKQEMDGHIDKLAQQKGIVDGNILDNNDRIQSLLGDLKAANDVKNQDEVNSISLELGILQEQNEKYKAMSQDIADSLAFLEKMYKNVGYFIRDQRMIVKYKKTEFKVVEAASNAIESAKRAFQGDPDKKLDFIRANDVLREEMYKKVGQMKRAISTSRDFMNSVDIQNVKYNNKAAELLKKLDSQGYAAFLTDPAEKEAALKSTTVNGDAVILESKPLSTPNSSSSTKRSLLDD